MPQPQYRINVYESPAKERVVARVRYNQCLDYWNGSNWQNGGVGRHMGITKLKTGEYVLIHGTQWQGERDWAEVVSAEDALQAILQSGNEELLETEKFQELKKLAEKEGILGDVEAEDEGWG